MAKFPKELKRKGISSADYVSVISSSLNLTEKETSERLHNNSWTLEEADRLNDIFFSGNGSLDDLFADQNIRKKDLCLYKDIPLVNALLEILYILPGCICAWLLTKKAAPISGGGEL